MNQTKKTIIITILNECDSLDPFLLILSLRVHLLTFSSITKIAVRCVTSGIRALVDLFLNSMYLKSIVKEMRCVKTVKIECSRRLIQWSNVVGCPNYSLSVSFISLSHNETLLEKLSGIIFLSNYSYCSKQEFNHSKISEALEFNHSKISEFSHNKISEG